MLFPVRNAMLIKLPVLLLLLLATAGMAGEQDSRYANIRVEFALLDQAGKVVTATDLRGKFVLLAFGFTHCAHICPLMAANMAMALKAAESEAMGVFISVDTERDTAAVTQAYASGFHPSMLGLSGSHENIRAAAINFGISYVVTKSQKAYTVEHTSDIFLIGPDGKVIEVFALNAPPLEMAGAMREAALP